MKILQILILATLTFLPLISSSQTVEQLNSLESKYQLCLDEGIDMLSCSKRYYFQMDSVLNVVYVSLRKAMTDTEKETLKKEQLKWLSSRDAYFKKKDAEFSKNFQSGEWGSDMAMITYGDKADYVKERVVELINKKNKLPTTTE